MEASPDALAKIIAHVESAGNQFAVRFEPKQYAEELRVPDLGETALIARLNQCTTETAQVIWAASWGAYQIMGYNLYEQGWRKSIFAYLNNPVAQLVSFSRYLVNEKLPTSWEAIKTDTAALEFFARRYNGSPAYATRMLAAARVLGL